MLGTVGVTDIIVGAVVAKHGDTPAAKLENEKGQRIECHGREISWRVVAVSPFALISLSV